MSTPMVDIVQTSGGFIAKCRVHGEIRPEPGKAWVSHIAAGVAAMTHALFVFHGTSAH